MFARFIKKEVYKCENYRPISLLSNISKIFGEYNVQ